MIIILLKTYYSFSKRGLEEYDTFKQLSTTYFEHANRESRNKNITTTLKAPGIYATLRLQYWVSCQLFSSYKIIEACVKN